nr:hypothetical protein [Bacteroidota bacterium]
MKNITKYVLGLSTMILVTGCLAQNLSLATNIETAKFQKLTNNEGLSQGTINAIAQDKKGFIWIGTNDGLNRYDGYDVKVFHVKIPDSTTISSNLINDIIVDRKGDLWIGTARGLNIYNPLTGDFRLVTSVHLDKSTDVRCLILDRSNSLWVGTSNHGLVQIDLKTGDSKAYKRNALHGLPGDDINTVFVDSENNLWVAPFEGGLYLYNRQADNFKYLKIENQQTS